MGKKMLEDLPEKRAEQEQQEARNSEAVVHEYMF